MNDRSKLNKSFDKLLEKQGLSLDVMPLNLEKWQKFIVRINNHYNDSDQERYILERSSDIASRESMDLNTKLEYAQRLANIGRWHYDRQNNRMTVPKEFYTLFGLEPNTHELTYEQVQKNIHYHDKQFFVDLIENALSSGEDGETEVRLIMRDKTFLWFHIICHPIANKEGKYNEVTGIVMEITKRKESEEKIANLNTQIVSSARFAGMAEVATSMLHNLGNILNSANVSLNLLKENTNQPYLNRTLKAIDLIKEHMTTLDTYLFQDDKGKLIPQYLVASSAALKNEQDLFKFEITNLGVHLNHIKDIVATQQSIARTTLMIQKIFLPEVIDLALQMSATDDVSENIQIHKEYVNFSKFVETDKAKLLQILINLIHNAKEAIQENKNTIVKEITISALAFSTNIVNIIIQDNGIGIAPENRIKIFSFGYTNKEKGHGFGLHSCALFAKEMGGELQVESEGLGKGATFTLSIPISQSLKEKL